LKGRAVRTELAHLMRAELHRLEHLGGLPSTGRMGEACFVPGAAPGVFPTEQHYAKMVRARFASHPG
ncbi:MAG: hypothetical protein IJT83_16360, partial [Victivallales bacterium]|nr:hypothetical protein [Victivallales bacterium]